MSNKYVIIHGHFYQPPRENPWIDTLETQVSAAPYHDWNERVYAECYRPNAFSRLLDPQGAIIGIHNNYSMMSFNFGPTLFSWLEQHHPACARRIIDADKASCARLEGHGNAIAQVFNHIIMPLSRRRDQLTQIRWAKQYFRERFRREPEGMWLAETAINMETVTCLIEEGIKYVILSPQQVEATRLLEGNASWASVHHGIDTHRAYRIFPSDQSGNRLSGFLDAFFFDQVISREASFHDLLKDATTFGNRINGAFPHHSSGDQAVIVATDGETFGHHKPFGDMCLAYFFQKIAPKLNIVPVNFGYFLYKNPPQHEVLLKSAFDEGTAWSCTHGLGRWARDCGCKTGGEPSWKQSWRAPLRSAVQKLQIAVDNEFEKKTAAAGLDPWQLRDDYSKVMEGDSAFIDFLRRHAPGTKFTRDQVFALRKLLEAQKYMLYSFTSCAWFFSDIGGLEAMQNLAYAARAMQMGIPPQLRPAIEREFLAEMEQAKGNVGGATGASLFRSKLERFFGHEKILAFTVAVERAVGIVRSDKERLFRFDFHARRLCTQKRGLYSYQGFEVSLENEMTGERSVWAVLVSHRNMAEVRGWIVEAIAFQESQADDMDPDSWMHHPAATTLTLSDIFITSRENMAEFVHQNIFKDTFDKYSAWMNNNEHELDLLSRLDFPMPLYCMAPLAFVYQQQWNYSIRRLERRGSEAEIALKLDDLSATVARFTIIIDMNESAGVLERIIIREVTALFSVLSTETFERIEKLLDIVDQHSFPVLKHKIEDAFSPIIAGPLKTLNDEVGRLNAVQNRSAGEQGSLEEKRTLLISLVKFARRMNFNVDSLQAA